MSSEKRPVDSPVHVRNHLLESAEIYRRVAGSCALAIETAAILISEVFRSEGKMLICGNGGSAADAQHIAAELVSRLSKELDRPGLPAIALTTDTSFITAYGNDVDFAGIFERQVQALGRPGDVLVAISTSGNSPNVLKAIALARKMSLRTIALTGEGGRLAGEVECAITIPSRNTQYVQEALLSVEHIICELVELALFT